MKSGVYRFPGSHLETEKAAVTPIEWARIMVGIKGAGEMATGVAIRLYRAGFSRILMMEKAHPLAVRRTVSFCEAVHDGIVRVEGVEAVRVQHIDDIFAAWKEGRVPVLIDPQWRILSRIRPQVVVDATIAKSNLGTSLKDAPLVIGLGPGFTAPDDVHRVVETMRGHDLGRVMEKGSALANTGVPGPVGGYTVERVLRAPATGLFHSDLDISRRVKAGDVVGTVEGKPVVAGIDGVLRGLIRKGTLVRRGIKIGDIDPRCDENVCATVSDKARAIGGAVLEAILGASHLLEQRVPHEPSSCAVHQ